MSSRTDEAIRVFNQGGIVVFPTDTAFGIGCRLDKEESISRLFTLRKRPHSQATPVLVSRITMAEQYMKPLPNVVRRLMQVYWPGALTIVFDCIRDKIPELVRGGGETIGIRQPNHADVCSIIDALECPILGPSANFHGKDTPYTFESLDTELIRKVDFVLPGRCSIGQASTVVDCSGGRMKVLRQGNILIPDAII